MLPRMYDQLWLATEIEKQLLEVCMVSPRSYSDVRKAFIEYLRTRPYSALDLARICYAQAMVDAPLPWEPGYKRSVLEKIFVNAPL